MFDCYLKRVIYNKKFEMTYVALSQVNNQRTTQTTQITSLSVSLIRL